MPYEKTQWNDHVVERQRTYNVVSNQDGTKTLVPAFGTVIQQGTPVDAEHLSPPVSYSANCYILHSDG